MDIFCECNSANCGITADIELEVYQKAVADGVYVIVDGCRTGPEPEDILVEKREGYSLYKD